MMIASPDDMRFSEASIDLLRTIKYAADQRVSDRAMEHAMLAGRTVVTEADIVAVVSSALSEVAAEQVHSENGQSPDLVPEGAARSPAPP